MNTCDPGYYEDTSPVKVTGRDSNFIMIFTLVCIVIILFLLIWIAISLTIYFDS